MISPRHFITAAHCFCETGNSGGLYFNSYKECDSDGSAYKGENFVYLPAFGLFGPTSAPILSPDYDRIPDNREIPAGSRLGDLAIIRLPSDVPVRYLPLADSRELVAYFSVGFGYSTGNPNSGIRINTPLLMSAVGLGTLAYHSKAECPPDGYADAFCTLYSPRSFAPNSTGAGACEGDSGGPLVGIDVRGVRYLMGVEGDVNGYSTKCEATADLLTTYTDARQHSEWIKAQLANVNVSATSPVAALTCREILLATDPDGYEVDVPTAPSRRNVITVASAGRPNWDSPKIEEVGAASETTCEPVLGRPNLLWCQVAHKPSVRLRLAGNGLVQISTCSFE